MKIENWNGHEIRINDKGQYNTADFMDLLEDLTDGAYLPPEALEGKLTKSFWGWYETEDGRCFRPTVWFEDELLDTDNPIVFADMEKAYGWELPKFEKKETEGRAEYEQYVYVIGACNSNLYKIGCSNNPSDRLQNLQIANPYELKLMAVFKSKHMFTDEKKIHQSLDEFRVRGEWFKLDNPVRVIMSVNEKHNLGLSVSKEIYKHIQQ